MKDLPIEELNSAPNIIQYIYYAAMTNTPIGMSLFEKAVDNHPEYFPDEIAHRKKWAAVPESVHKSYEAEIKELVLEIKKSLPPRTNFSTGIVSFIERQRSEEFEKFNTALNDLLENNKHRFMEIHRKHYEIYGLPFVDCRQYYIF